MGPGHRASASDSHQMHLDTPALSGSNVFLAPAAVLAQAMVITLW
jgi:hypothetical protein